MMHGRHHPGLLAGVDTPGGWPVSIEGEDHVEPGEAARLSAERPRSIRAPLANGIASRAG